jgi:hypothetical protein
LGYPFAAQVMLVAQCLRSTVGKTDGEGQRSPHSVLLAPAKKCMRITGLEMRSGASAFRVG